MIFSYLLVDKDFVFFLYDFAFFHMILHFFYMILHFLIKSIMLQYFSQILINKV